MHGIMETFAIFYVIGFNTLEKDYIYLSAAITQPDNNQS